MKEKKFGKGVFFKVKTADSTSCVHCKIITPQVISDDPFVDGCSLVYLYSGNICDNMTVVQHTPNSLFSMKMIYLKEGIPRDLAYIGTEPVFEWELNIDIGIKSVLRGEWIASDQIQEYQNDHIIAQLEKGYIAIPFYDVNNVRLNHIPHIQLEEVCTTINGLLK